MLAADDVTSWEAAEIREILLSWHRRHGRDLPLRGTTDPWRLLVIEVASQQTQLSRALEGAAAFCARFPSPAALASATPADAIRAWAGLGYNRRALALHRAAVEIVRGFDGLVPSEVPDLERLPGVGPYTARAVAAQAFGRPVGALDVNVARLLGRLAGGRRSRGELQAVADGLVDRTDPGGWVRAVIDFAAVICTARSPACDRCPLRARCPSAFSPSGASGGTREPRPVSTPFPSTRRWLRGAIVRELREASPGAWLPLAGPRGRHGQGEVREAVAALCRDGLAEQNEIGEVRLAEGTAG